MYEPPRNGTPVLLVAVAVLCMGHAAAAQNPADATDPTISFPLEAGMGKGAKSRDAAVHSFDVGRRLDLPPPRAQ